MNIQVRKSKPKLLARRDIYHRQQMDKLDEVHRQRMERLMAWTILGCVAVCIAIQVTGVHI